MKIKLLFFTLFFTICTLKAQISITFTNVVQPCNGNNGSATAIVTGGTQPYTYSWNQMCYFPHPQGGVVSTTNSISSVQSGYYYLTVTDALNHQAKDTLFLSGAIYFLHDTVYYVQALKRIDLFTNCPTGTVNFNAQIGGSNPPYTFSLSSVGTQTTSSLGTNFNNLSAGSYTCTVRNNLGCTDTTLVYITNNCNTSINSFTIQSNFLNIYPNPNTGNFTIETNSFDKKLLQIFDVTGKMVLSQSINGKTDIDVSNLINGVYFIQVKTDENISTQKILVQY
jgi:hypothetical protein